MFDGVIQGIVSGASKIFDDLHVSKEERAVMESRMFDLVTQRMKVAQDSVNERMQTVAKVISSENQSGDNYTRRARPTVVYFGLAVIGWNYLLMPTLAAMVERIVWQPVVLPGDFWLAWGGIVGVWSLGRSAERMAVQRGEKTSSLVEKITGTL